MTTSSSNISSALRSTFQELRLHLFDEPTVDQVDGSWWPHSRDLEREGAELIDHFPPERGRISRLLFSRPDWDNATDDDRGLRSIRTERGRVKIGSFPSDDTHLMIATMSSGRRLKLLVIPSDTPPGEGEARLQNAEGA